MGHIPVGKSAGWDTGLRESDARIFTANQSIPRRRLSRQVLCWLPTHTQTSFTKRQNLLKLCSWPTQNLFSSLRRLMSLTVCRLYSFDRVFHSESISHSQLSLNELCKSCFGFDILFFSSLQPLKWLLSGSCGCGQVRRHHLRNLVKGSFSLL